MKKSVFAALVLLLGAASMPFTAQALIIFSENFEDGTVDPAITSVSTLAVDTAPSGQQFLGLADGSNNTEPSNRGLSNTTVSLSLLGLAAHSAVTLNFSLYVINSMDGNELFTVSEATAGVLLAATCSNVFNVHQCTLSAPAPGIRAPDSTNTLGFTPLNPGVTASDSIYNFALPFAHSATSLALTFTYTNQQGIPDESWGLDNISVDVNGRTPPPGKVPEPGSLMLLGLALAGLWVARRRRTPLG